MNTYDSLEMKTRAAQVWRYSGAVWALLVIGVPVVAVTITAMSSFKEDDAIILCFAMIGVGLAMGAPFAVLISGWFKMQAMQALRTIEQDERGVGDLARDRVDETLERLKLQTE